MITPETSKDTALSLPESGSTAKRFREATDAASVCKSIVLKTACDISGRKYVKVEGWMAIATAHGCIASIKSVEEIPAGVRAIAELRRGDQILTAAEGFVGRDEPTWYGGKMMRWNKVKRQEVEVDMPKRADYAIRAMAQTRALSRVCRAAFAHVVVLMNEGLETTPAEEVNEEPEPIDVETTRSHEPQSVGEVLKANGATTTETQPSQEEKKAQKADAPTATVTPSKHAEVPRDESLKYREQFRGGKWQTVAIHFGKKKGTTLGELEDTSLTWWITEWQPKPFGANKTLGTDDMLLRAALDVAAEETQGEGT